MKRGLISLIGAGIIAAVSGCATTYSQGYYQEPTVFYPRQDIRIYERPIIRHYPIYIPPRQIIIPQRHHPMYNPRMAPPRHFPRESPRIQHRMPQHQIPRPHGQFHQRRH